MSKRKVHTIIVLDRSGSMDLIREQTISGFNEQLQTMAKNAEGLEATVSLVTFSDDVRFDVWQKPLAAVEPLTRKSYDPGGWTRMYDAVGEAVDRILFEDGLDKKANYLFVIISDGQENASRDYTSAMIADRVKRLQKKESVTFWYLGANQDLTQVARNTGIDLRNTASFSASAAGMQNTSKFIGSNMQSYYGSISASGSYSGSLSGTDAAAEIPAT